ncbi:MAG: primosomal protein N' (replication factor Y) [Candidatus Endobugula sp.]|jgi:primosomal protein N' (replication factor Y)
MPIHTHSLTTLSVAIPSPLRRVFDYLPNPATNVDALIPGMRLSLPFGHQKAIVGILMSINKNASNSTIKLRPIHSVLDELSPALDNDVLELCKWCSHYYHYPLGEVCHLALPSLLRKAVPAPKPAEAIAWQLTKKGQQCDEAFFGRAKKQFAAWEATQQQQVLLPATAKTKGISRTTIKTLLDKGILEQTTVKKSKGENEGLEKDKLTPNLTLIATPELPLNTEQADALNAIDLNSFNAYLLDGITGSGKTEVYLQAIAKVIKAGKQALVLVPEIGLTPQTVQRFQQRFNVAIATLHSGISDKQRFIAWQDAKENNTAIIIGTRSAVFTPLSNLGLIIVDEEHDLSYKQQDGVRYSARDTAIIRAQKKNIPIILGSATPALETLHNALSGRFSHLRLTERATSAKLPIISCIDSADSQLSPTIINAIKETLEKQQQALVFINRRGYAPTLICQDCGWISQCDHCDSRMTLHKLSQHHQQLHCHHCDTKTPIPKQCPQCHSVRLQALGQGTQRSEEELAQVFNDVPILRIDRDSISRKGELEAALAIITSNTPCILVGTQMLAKGHHFPNVSLAVILGLDNSFFSSDFRGSERMGQLLTQVAGRSGREKHQGTVLLQTQFSDHPLLRKLIDEGYPALAQQLLAERRLSDMPPYQYLALLRCHAQQPAMAMNFLQQARRLAERIQAPSTHLQYIGPLAGIIEKRNNRYYYQLQIKAKTRSELHTLLAQLCPQLEQQRAPKGLHWLIDVDPQDG